MALGSFSKKNNNKKKTVSFYLLSSASHVLNLLSTPSGYFFLFFFYPLFVVLFFATATLLFIRLFLSIFLSLPPWRCRFFTRFEAKVTQHVFVTAMASKYPTREQGNIASIHIRPVPKRLPLALLPGFTVYCASRMTPWIFAKRLVRRSHPGTLKGTLQTRLQKGVFLPSTSATFLSASSALSPHLHLHPHPYPLPTSCALPLFLVL